MALHDNPFKASKGTRRSQVIPKITLPLKCHTYRLYLLTATNPTPAAITETKTQKAKLFYVVSSTLLNYLTLKVQVHPASLSDSKTDLESGL